MVLAAMAPRNSSSSSCCCACGTAFNSSSITYFSFEASPLGMHRVSFFSFCVDLVGGSSGHSRGRNAFSWARRFKQGVFELKSP